MATAVTTANTTRNSAALGAVLFAALGASLVVVGAGRWPGSYAASFAEVTYRQAALLGAPLDEATLDRAAARLDPSRAAFLDMRLAQERGLRTAAGRARLRRAAGELERGLRLAPADAYAWTRRAAVLVQLAGASESAARSLSFALMIAPHDRRLGPIQFDLAVVLWPQMDVAGHEALAPQLHAFAATALGQSLLAGAK